MHLRDALARLGAQRLAQVLESQMVQPFVGQALLAVLGRQLFEFLDVRSIENPLQPQWRQSARTSMCTSGSVYGPEVS